MNKNISIIIGSPKNEKSNSEIISNSLGNKLTNKNLSCCKLYAGKTAEDTLMKNLDKSDVIVLILPIYENSVPSTILKFFEAAYENREELSVKERKLFVITNSGFPKPEAGRSAIKTCSLFAQAMSFKWLGGIIAAPGTLMDGNKKLEEEGSYKKLVSALNLIAHDISMDREISSEVFKLMSKSFLMPLIYRIAGRILQNKVIKSLGKDSYFSKPLEI